MKHSSLTKPYCTAKKQHGGMLIESLIGVLIMAILGGGIMHVTARMLNTQRDTAVTNVVVNELRPLIMSRSVCVVSTASASAGASSSESTTTYTAANKTINVPGAANGMTVTTANCELKEITIDGTKVMAPQPVVLTVGNSSDGSLVKVGGQ